MAKKKSPDFEITVLNERAQHLLRALINNYIREGTPVGSRTLARDTGLSLSPATIRNVMADLEDLGLIHAPHTSAGRVPTAKGFRIFVDSLLQVEDLAEEQANLLKQELDSDDGLDSGMLLKKASDLLSDVTQMAGIVTMPQHDQMLMRHVEFLPLSARRVLAILVTNDEEVHNRIIHTQKDYSPSELTQAANYLNEAFAGKDIQAVREQLLNDMKHDRQRIDNMMLMAIEMANKVFEPSGEKSDFLLAGQTKLMGLADMGDMDRMRQLFEAFNAKRDILHLLDESLSAEGVKIFIGEESGYQPLEKCSVVASPYEVSGRIVGVLGVIGPTRMAYDRVIPVVDMTARLLGAALNRR